MMNFVTPRRASLLLYGIGTILMTFLPGPYRVALGAAVLLHFALFGSIEGKWRKRFRWPLVLVALLGFLLPKPAAALFGFGDIVFDPSAYATLLQQFAQMQQSYQVAANTYEQAKFNLTHFDSTVKAAWQGLQMTILQSNTPDAYGENAGYTQAVNTGQGTTDAWNASTAMLQPAADYAQLPPNSPELAEMANAERYQGYGPNALAIIGQTRANGLSNQQTLAQLQSSYTNNPDDTEGEQLNTLNGSNLLLVQGIQDQNIILAVMAESQAIHAKVEQDQLTQHFNTVAYAETMKQTTPTEVTIDDASVSSWMLQ